MSINRHTRREFLQLSGVAATGLLLSACLPEEPESLDHGEGFRASVFVAIEPDGTVLIAAARSEMGQGVRATLPQIVADELDADWQQVRVVQATGDARYGNQNTDGSRSIRNHFQRMREFGANARSLLVVAAARQWLVPPAECRTDLHRVLHPDSGRSLSYGELAIAARDMALPEGFSPALKDPSQFRYIGQSLPHVDLPAITTGEARYGADIRLPGQLYAVISRSPVVGGSVERLKVNADRQGDGVVDIVEIPGQSGPPGFHPQAGVAVIARDTWSALKGRSALDIRWNPGAHGNHHSERYLAQLQQSSRQPGPVAREQGDVDAAMASAVQVVEAQYTVPYLAHATMEPPAATAWYRDGRCEIWAPSQDPQKARTHVASLLGLKEAAVTVHVTLLGGGFGRKSKPDFILEAAWLSRRMKTPIQLLWSREDDIRHDYYHAASAQQLQAGLDAEGRPTAWRHRSVYPGIGTTFSKRADNLGELSLGCVDLPYDIPNIRIEGGDPTTGLRIGWLRSVGNIQHAFAINSFTHELALVAGKDPAHYLLELIGPDRQVSLGPDTAYRNYGMPLKDFPIDNARLRTVIETAMKGADWGAPLPPGHGLGIAAHRSFLSYVATVIEVAAGEDGKIRIERAISAIDAGRIVNPDRLQAQAEGGLLFGLSLALYGEISVQDGRVQQGNFHDYPVLRLRDAPPVEIHLIASEQPPTGAGEPPTPPTAAALCNAVQAATGQRIRRLPLSRHGLA